MSLEAILKAIRASGQAQVQEIENQADAEITQMLAQTEAESQMIYEQTRQAALGGAIRECARILHEARLKGIRLVGDTQKSLVDAALDRAKEQLAQRRSMPVYPAALRSLIEEALTELSPPDQEQVQLQADPRDRLLLEDILPDIEFAVQATYPLNSWGGVVVTSRDGRIVVDNTLEARLQRADSFLQRHLPLFLEKTPSPAYERTEGNPA